MEPGATPGSLVAVKTVTAGPGGNHKADKKVKEVAVNMPQEQMEMVPPPAFLEQRLEMFTKLQKNYHAEIAERPRQPITIIMPDGSIENGVSWETTPAEIARRSVSNNVFKRIVVAQLNGDSAQLWDLERPLEASCQLKFLTFDDPEGQKVFWHSSAHVLGEACERLFGCSLCIGPPIDNGFYYEMALPGGATVTENDWKPLESIVRAIVKERQKFERLELSKDDLLAMFAYNKYKQHIIRDKILDGTYTTVYRNGPLIDLCRGPHVSDTSRIEAFEIVRNSSSYFLGDQKNDSLQRIYGVSFPDKKRLAEYKRFIEEAARRDHRKIGREQELFFFHELSPGSAFWLPHGARIFNTLLRYIQEQYWKRGYDEVVTPNMFNADLWKTSGHWANYKDDMFTVGLSEDTTFALKPMNCPGHCLMFSHRERSYRELPWRVADFGVLHRNEASGALSGLTRVRRFQQDDAHIFCREDQIKQEIDGLFDFLLELYGLLGFTFELRLSTRPEKFMGDLETWNRAEAILAASLDDFAKRPGGVPWTYNHGDGAFYGPKIDIKVFDCMKRDLQCATIQLDFVQPINFGLEYMTDNNRETDAAHGLSVTSTLPHIPKNVDKPEGKAEDQDKDNVERKAKGAADTNAERKTDGNTEDNIAISQTAKAKGLRPLTPGYARPVVIHRAMCGSLERFIAVLCEHFAGKWPFWLSPRQVVVIPVGRGFTEYAEKVKTVLHSVRLFVDVDLSGNTLQKKVRSAQLAQYNFIFVVGQEEQEGNFVNVRNRDDTSSQDRGKPIPLDMALEHLVALRDSRGSYNPFPTAPKDKEGKAGS